MYENQTKMTNTLPDHKFIIIYVLSAFLLHFNNKKRLVMINILLLEAGTATSRREDY